MKTGATLFGGGEGVGVGMQQAGVNHLWGIEYDKAICDVAKMNGFNSLHLDVLQADPQVIVAEHGEPDILHASPPCPNFSTAKANAREAEHDKALAQAVCDFIRVIRPQIFTLENVYQYRNSHSWAIIQMQLHQLGYALNLWHLNAANFGVPQTRKRMIAIARRDGVIPQRPPATHTKEPLPLFDDRLPWVGWYEAIEDIYRNKIPYNFTDFVISKTMQVDNCLIDAQNLSFSEERLTALPREQPAYTVNASKSLSENMIKDNGDNFHCSTRFLARFQSFPDTYKLPDKKSLACRVIGNAVPSLLYQRVIESQI